MAKVSYKIPTSLDSSPLDVEIALRSDSGLGLRPLPLRFLFAVFGSAILWFWFVRVTPVGDMGVLFIVLFTIAWIITSFVLLKLDKTGTLAIERVPAMIAYIPHSARHVKCRTSDSAGPFYTIANIKEIDEDRGIIFFADGDVGYAYRVVGSGSVLLFDEDREAILDRVDAFYRIMHTDYELIFITAREAQNVKRQLRNMDARIKHLQGDDPELIELAQMERRFLKDWVGGSFRSIHQYMILKARSLEQLEIGKNVLRNEVESSSLMFKRCVALYDDELHAMLRSVFQGRESL